MAGLWMGKNATGSGPRETPPWSIPFPTITILIWIYIVARMIRHGFSSRKRRIARPIPPETGREIAQPLRAIPDPLGRPVHGGGNHVGNRVPRGGRGHPFPGVRGGEPHQHPDRGADLADDLPDDAQGRLFVGP